VPTISSWSCCGSEPGKPTGDGPPLAGIESAWEGSFDARGKWIAGRLLNGDQTHQGRHIRLAPGKFQIQRVRLYRYRRLLLRPGRQIDRGNCDDRLRHEW
jgi:hypothetical protein